MKKKKLSKVGRALLALLTKILVIGIIVCAVLTWILGVYVCHTNDMFPSIKDGDLTITYKLGGYYNGDCVVYEIDGETYFGRVIGVAGDEINFTENGYTLNGNIPYETIVYKTEPRESGVVYPLVLKEGELFVLADYREEGLDSRTFGAVINPKGKIVLVLRRRGI